MSTPKTVFEPYPDSKNSPLGQQKVKNGPRIKSKSKVRIECTKENKCCSTTSQHSFLNTTSIPKRAHYGSKSQK